MRSPLRAASDGPRSTTNFHSRSFGMTASCAPRNALPAERIASVAKPRVERVAQRVGEDLQREDDAEEREARERDLPPQAAHQLALGGLDQDAPRRLVLDSHAQEREHDL